MASEITTEFTVRPATLKDLQALLEIESDSFDSDRLTRRSMRHWILAEHAQFLVLTSENELAAYGLVWCHRGTRLARLYSLAVAVKHQGKGFAKILMEALENRCAQDGYLFMRLEVSKSNTAAIALYRKLGYRSFGEYHDYYADHSDALRMQKTIRKHSLDSIRRTTPWYQQTTHFTCGPASLMMAMASLDAEIEATQVLELDLWREATSIFMTSGHGGCHPFGLGLAAAKRGFEAEVYVNSNRPLFVDGVRSSHKKEVMTLVHEHFLQQVKTDGHVHLHYQDYSQADLDAWLSQGFAVLALISTYRLDGKRAPHWVTITGADDQCFYVHDPDPAISEGEQLAIDCQYLPIARQDFEKMSAFGAGRLRTAIAIRR